MNEHIVFSFSFFCSVNVMFVIKSWNLSTEKGFPSFSSCFLCCCCIEIYSAVWNEIENNHNKLRRIIYILWKKLRKSSIRHLVVHLMFVFSPAKIIGKLIQRCWVHKWTNMTHKKRFLLKRGISLLGVFFSIYLNNFVFTSNPYTDSTQ